MCGIVGLYAKSAATRAQLGAHAGRMLIEMGDRGPDSAGIAVYRDPAPAGATKLSLHARGGAADWDALVSRLARDVPVLAHRVIGPEHALVTVQEHDAAAQRAVAVALPEVEMPAPLGSLRETARAPARGLPRRPPPRHQRGGACAPPSASLLAPDDLPGTAPPPSAPSLPAPRRRSSPDRTPAGPRRGRPRPRRAHPGGPVPRELPRPAGLGRPGLPVALLNAVPEAQVEEVAWESTVAVGQRFFIVCELRFAGEPGAILIQATPFDLQVHHDPERPPPREPPGGTAAAAATRSPAWPTTGRTTSGACASPGGASICAWTAPRLGP